jgi:hypothetical protein
MRLLLVGGGAVVLATAGFAYMASNTIDASSAGAGSGTVSGYTATGVSWTTELITEVSPAASYTDGVTFTLTANDTSDASAVTAPKSVFVYATNGSGTPISDVEYYGPAPQIGGSGSDDTGTFCTLTPTGTTGQWTVSCDFNDGSGGWGPLTSAVDGLYVSANQ